jgi:integrase
LVVRILFSGPTHPRVFRIHQQTAALRAESKRKSELLDRRAGFSKVKLAPKFEEHVEKFLAWSKENHRPKTHDLHKTNCDTLLRFFRGCWLDEITREIVEDFKAARSREKRLNAHDGSIVSPPTVNRGLTTLKLLFNYAENCGYAVSNPVRGVAFYPEGDGRTRVVSFDEEIAYFAAASQPLKDVALVIIDTGMRPEEVFRIRTENLNFAERSIFNPFGKHRAAKRKVAMTADVFELLKTRAREGRGPFVFPSKNDLGRPIGSVRKAHDATVERAGIAEHFKLYDLRHTFATRAVAAGVDLPTLSAILGHTKIQMTMRYVHPAEEQKKIAAGKFEHYRVTGLLQAAEKRHGVPTISPTVN